MPSLVFRVFVTSDVFSSVSHAFLAASAVESVVVAAAAAADAGGLLDDGTGTAFVVAAVCMIVATVEIGVTELDADCTIIFELKLYKYASYSGSGSNE